MTNTRQFDILIIGRSSGDLVLNEPHRLEFKNNAIEVYGENGKHYHIPTDSTPSNDNDKVTALISLDEFIERFSHMYRWGGGAINSAQTLFNLRVPTSQMGVTVMTPSRPYLKVGNEVKDIIDFFSENNANHCMLNYTKQNYNIVMSGENKIVVRNKPSTNEDFKLSRENMESILGYMNPSDGILINSLNNQSMTEFIVQSVFFENQSFYKDMKIQDMSKIEEAMSDENRLPKYKHRKVMTVITNSSKIPRNTLIDKILPYTGIIINQEDIINNFYGTSKEIKKEIYDIIGNDLNLVNRNYNPIIKVIAQMRFGIPTEHGVKRYVEDSKNNIYVTLGKHGHLISIENKVYHVRIKEEIIEYINEKIKQNKSSTNGAGDAFAAGIIHEETIGNGQDYLKTAAFANTAVARYLGINLDIISSEVEVLKEYDLNKFKSDENLYRMNLKN